MGRIVSLAFLIVLTTAASAATVDTPAGNVDIPQPSDQYIGRHSVPLTDPDISWGKAGVSYDQYQHDAHYCAALGVLLAIKAPAWTLSRGGGVEEVMEKRYPNSQLDSFGEANLERCLVDRGYIKFRLTPDQEAHLQALAREPDARHHYLHSLGSDADVLARQKL